MKIEIVLKKGAFTILELLLVAALLSVVAAGSYAFLIKGSSEIADIKMQSAILADLQRDFVSVRRNLDFSMTITKELLNNGSGTSPRMLSPDIECVSCEPFTFIQEDLSVGTYPKAYLITLKKTAAGVEHTAKFLLAY